MMQKLLAGLFIYVLAVGLGILVMIHGYGITPVNWWWVVGGATVGRFLVEMMNALSKSD